MSEPIPDLYESYPIKNDLWYKNNEAHKVMRAKQNQKPFCAHCHNRHCYDYEKVRGDKALKKCKFSTTYSKPLKNSDTKEAFINHKNGEITCNDLE